MAAESRWWTVIGRYRVAASPVFWLQYVKARNPAEALKHAVRQEHRRQGWVDGRDGFRSPIKTQMLFEGRVSPFEDDKLAKKDMLLAYDPNYPRATEPTVTGRGVQKEEGA